MRLLHTSDWHLGKRLFKLDRAEEHALFLDWLIQTLIQQNIDVLLIAGDIFDTPTPPHSALEMFYSFLHRVSTQTCVRTYLIAGNHDSGILLEAPSQILTMHRVKVWGKLSANIQDHWTTIEHNNERIELCAIPFFRSHELLGVGEGEALAALNKYLTREKSCPQFLMLHHLAGIFEAAGSEQVVSLSGVDSIPHEVLSSFDYVALGHIHKPQKIGPQCFYSGSPIPMRFSETLKKSLVLIDQVNQTTSTTILPIPVFRNLLMVRANEMDYEQKIKDLAATGKLTPMVEVQLNLTAPKVGLIDRIKEILASQQMELLSYMPIYASSENTHRKRENLFELSTLELFEEFYAVKYPEAKDMPEELKGDFKALLEKVKNAPHKT